MQVIDCMVGNLRNMALDMGSEISDQNEQLDRITLKVTKSKIVRVMAIKMYGPTWFLILTLLNFFSTFQATCNENRVTNANKKAVALLKN